MKQSTFSKWLLAITMTHFVLGLVIFKVPLLHIIKQGWWDTVGPENLELAVAFWFMIFTFPLFVLISNMWSSHHPVSKTTLYLCLYGSVLSALTIPASGFWTLTLLSVIALIKSNSSDDALKEQ